MSDTVPLLEQMAAASDSREDVFNATNDALSPSSLYGRRRAACIGLVFGYYGGFFNDVDVANGTVTATASNTNYVVAHRTTGAVTISTATTNWNDQTTYLRLWQLTAGGSTITARLDKRQAVGITAGSGTPLTPEQVEDYVAALFAAGTHDGVTVTYADATPSLSLAARTPNVQTVSSSATVTPTFSNDIVLITAQATGLTLANPTGTPIDALGMVIRIKDNGTAQSITYDTQYRAMGITLPITTVISKTLYLAMIWNATDTKFDVLAVGQEA